ncbi:MAG: hypothetical protein RSA53_10705 [Odoribacter sp.]
MKNTILYIWVLLAGLLAACNDDPEFPDPGLDATSNVRDTVRRDTMDVYYLEMRVKAPNGVNTIQVLNGLNYAELDRLDEYAGQSDFLLRYAVDLKEITDRDTILNYLIKVEDNDMRSYNKAFQLVVKRFSTPTVTVSGVQGTLGLVSPVFELKAFFETGLNLIHSYKVIFEGTTLDEGTLGDTLSEYHYSHVCNLEMQKGRNYQMTIQLTDSKGTTNEEHLTLNLIGMQRPVKVIINTYRNDIAKLNRELEFYYDPQRPERLDSICGVLFSSNGNVPYVYSFDYNDRNVVERVTEWKFGDKGERFVENAWTYTFDAQHRLTGAFGDEESKYDLECTDWYDDGRVKRFGFREDLPVTSEVAWQTSASGEVVIADLWVYNKRALGTKMTAVTIPSYLPSLPPFIPIKWGRPISEEIQLLMWQYGFEWVHQWVKSKGNDLESYYSTQPKLEYAYVTNTNGRLEKILKRTVASGVGKASKEFLFIYE